MTRRVGLDTCVVLRLLTGLPEDQARRARAFLDVCAHGGIEILISDLVAAETYHALLYYYDVPQPVALDTMRAFLAAPGVRATGHAARVLASYRGTGAGFVDRLILADYRAQAASVGSFEKAFGRLDDVQSL